MIRIRFFGAGRMNSENVLGCTVKKKFPKYVFTTEKFVSARKATCLRYCYTLGKNSRRERPTRFHVGENLVANSKAHRLHASDTPLKNCQCRWYPCQRTWTMRRKNSEVLCFQTEECANYPNLTQDRDRRQQGILGAHVMYLEQAVTSLFRV